MIYGWNHPLTAARYEEFSEGPTRYERANRELVARAELRPGHAVLDFAAGTGRTAEALLEPVSPSGRVLCVEPSDAMRQIAARRLAGRPVRMTAKLPTDERFDRALCGAAVWQVCELGALFARVRELLAERGLFAFTIPSLYLGEPDRPGGGRDPELTELWSRVADGRVPRAEAGVALPSREELALGLETAGFAVQSFRFEHRLTQLELMRWMRIPVITDALLGDLELEERDRRIDAAYRACDPSSFRWEGWSVFTARC